MSVSEAKWAGLLCALLCGSSACNVGSGLSSLGAPSEPDSGTATASVVTFAGDVQADLDAAGCSAAGSCHGGGAPMVLVANPATDEERYANYLAVSQRAGQPATSSLLVANAVGAGSHSEPLGVGDPIIQRWLTWIEQGSPYEGENVPDGGGTDGAPSWERDIGALVAASGCTSCHDASEPSGNYCLLSYSAALGGGSDVVPNVIAGDATSKLIEYCGSAKNHFNGPQIYDRVREWIVGFEAAQD